MKRFTFEVNTSGLTKLLEKADELAKELSETMQEIENYKLDCQVIKSGAPNEDEFVPLHDLHDIRKSVKRVNSN